MNKRKTFITVTLPIDEAEGLLALYGDGLHYYDQIILDQSDPASVNGWKAERAAAMRAERRILTQLKKVKA
jgi:hypothetical protein